MGLWSQKSEPRLEGAGLRLRLPRRNDFTDFQTLRADSYSFLKPFVPKWTEVEIRRAAYEKKVQMCAKAAQKRNEFSFFLFRVEQEKETLLGCVTLSKVSFGAAYHANLGYWIGEKFARNGYMSNGVSLVLPFAFSVLNLKRVHAVCLPNNVPSKKILLKNRFVEEGFAEQYLQIDGEWRDHILFGLTAQKFNGVKGI